MIIALLILLYIIAGSFLCMSWIMDYGATNKGWWLLCWFFVPGALIGVMVAGFISGIVSSKKK